MNNLIKKNCRGKIHFDQPQEIYVVEFGNIELTFKENQFSAFKSSVSLLNYQQTDNNTYLLTLVTNKITLRLNQEELYLLRDLLGLESVDPEVVRIKVNISMN